MVAKGGERTDSEGAERIKSPMRDVRNEGLHKREVASRRGRRIYGSILSAQLAFRSNVVAFEDYTVSLQLLFLFIHGGASIPVVTPEALVPCGLSSCARQPFGLCRFFPGSSFRRRLRFLRISILIK